MLCEECQKNQATFSITVTTGDEVTTRHLCGDCMKKMELSLYNGDIQSFLSSILSELGNAQPDESPVCSGCGLSYADFERTGRLGCAQCYDAFSEQLKPVLQRIHGFTQHVGRTPHHALANVPQPEADPEQAKLELQLEDLRKKMDDAVASENFEDAAKYRDELRALQHAQEGEERQ